MREPNVGRAILSGVVAWIVFVILLYLAPLLGVPTMDLPAMLGGMFGVNSVTMGWALFFVVGIVFALLYAYWGVYHLPGRGWQRGLVFGLLPWLVMMVIVAPLLPLLNPMVAMKPPGFFFANMGIIATIGSLIAHLIWGMVLGAVYGNVAERPEHQR